MTKRWKLISVSAMLCTVVLHASAYKHYTVKKGETLSHIAHKYHVSLRRLCKINGLTSHSTLKTGAHLKIPQLHAKRKHKRVHYISRKTERRLAKALIRIDSKKSVRVDIKQRKRIVLNDIVFGKPSDYHGKIPEKARRIIALAKQKLGHRYVWGAQGKNTFDCSGLTSYVCKANGIKLPRRAIQQSKVGKFVPRDKLQPGDLVFFDTSKHRRGYVNHVGIYIGNGMFIHASSAKKKVIITSLNKPFYAQRFKGGRRVVDLGI